MNGNLKSNIPYVRLGNSGLKVSRLILGCMSYGSPEWQDWVLPEDESIMHIKAAYDAGINTFDTANVYSNGLSEVVLGKAIKLHSLPREEIVVMTKVYFAVGKTTDTITMAKTSSELDGTGHANQHGLSRKHIFASVKQSLERLQLDYIDVLQCHRFDTETPIEETMQALHDIVKIGYVRYIGMSSCWAYQYYATQNNLTPFISMQNHYSLVYREEEREMFPTLKHFGVGSITWSPLARGLLSRPLDQQTKRGQSDRSIILNVILVPENLASSSVEEIAKKKGAKMAQIAIAWVMARDGVTAPIIGTTSLENLDELLAAVDIKLSEDEMKYLEEAYRPRSIIGHS
ncbi:aryl-alcohol dehydrogenase [Lentinula edodes]|nr:aryl-alcohol dehydrogenase [Lentinula edodes]